MPAARRPIIGIIGGIGSGKTAVARILEQLGCVVAYSDEHARAALRDPDIRATLIDWWGNDILDDAGEVDRSRVAKIVFNDRAERARLEALTHPWIEQRRRALFDNSPADAPALVIDAPLLLEAGLGEQCDAIIFVDTDRPTRLRRLAASRGWDDVELTRRENSQMSLDEKRARAHHVVKNTGDLDDLSEHVRQVLATILRTHG